MTMISSSELQLDTPAGALDADVRPPGERYFRHPGDVLRLLLWGAVTATTQFWFSCARAYVGPSATSAIATTGRTRVPCR